MLTLFEGGQNSQMEIFQGMLATFICMIFLINLQKITVKKKKKSFITSKKFS